MVGKNIKRFREAKEMNQEALAEKLNVTRQAVSNWETEKTQPDIDTLQRIADILEVSIEELIYGAQKKSKLVNITIGDTIGEGVGFGAVLATVISYAKWHSIGWAMLHGLLNWVYVIYYVIRYGWS